MFQMSWCLVIWIWKLLQNCQCWCQAPNKSLTRVCRWCRLESWRICWASTRQERPGASCLEPSKSNTLMFVNLVKVSTTRNVIFRRSFDCQDERLLKSNLIKSGAQDHRWFALWAKYDLHFIKPQIKVKTNCKQASFSNFLMRWKDLQKCVMIVRDMLQNGRLISGRQY